MRILTAHGIHLTEFIFMTRHALSLRAVEEMKRYIALLGILKATFSKNEAKFQFSGSS